MASRSRAGSGGKILRPRRLARVATPYERPPDAASSPQNPNWVSKFIFSPTKVIASTAGKFISTVFGPESSSSSSSYSGSGSGSDSDDESDENDVIDSSVGVDGLTKVNDGSGTRKKIPVRVEKHENKLLIEQLILQESFSWEECIKLISIIRSRVVEGPVHLEAEGAGPSELPNKGSNTDMPDLLNAALMEAKKWLKDKKLGSSQEMEMEYAVGGVDPNMSRNAAEGELGSPVDVAKSYMKERPPWASPCFTDAALGTTTPNRAQLFKEDMPISAGDNSLLYTKIKRDPRMSGSWNISEEIRRVRSRATEEMLRTPSTKFDLSKSKLKSSSSAKFDWSGSSSLQHKNSFHSFTANDLNALGDKAHGSTNLTDASPRTPALDVAHAASATTTHSSRLENGTPFVNPPVLKTSEKDQDLRDNMIPEDQDGVADGLGDAKTTLPSEAADGDVDTTDGDVDTTRGGGNNQQQYGGVDSSRMSDGVCSLSKEDLSIEEDGGEEGPTPNNNGSSLNHTIKESGDKEEEGERRRRSFYGYDDDEEVVRQKKKKKKKVAATSSAVASEQRPTVQMEEQTMCALLSEASVLVPEVNVNVIDNEGDSLEPPQQQDATTPKRSKKVVRYVKRTTRVQSHGGRSSNKG